MTFRWAPIIALTDWLDCGWMVAKCNAPMHHHEYALMCVWLCQCNMAVPR